MKKCNQSLSKALIRKAGICACLALSLLLASCAGAAAGGDDDDGYADKVSFTVDSDLAARIASRVPSTASANMARTLGDDVYSSLFLDLELVGGYTASQTL